jgi:uncharacterized protein
MKKMLFLLVCLWGGMALYADEASHYAAAEALIVVSMPEVAYTDMIKEALAQQIQINPSLEPLQDIMLAFMNKYMSLDAIKPDLIRLHMNYFSEQELQEMTAFYQTPVGQKSAQLMPQLFQAGAAIGQQKVQDNMVELQTAIINAMGSQGF